MAKIHPVEPWTSGWLGVSSSEDTQGFATLIRTPGRGARAVFTMRAPDGEWYDIVVLRYVRSRARVDLWFQFPGLDDETGESHESEQWGTALIPVEARSRMRELVDAESNDEELFTRMTAFHANDFHPITNRYADYWLDSMEESFPDPSKLWRPVVLPGIAAFETSDVTPELVAEAAEEKAKNLPFEITYSPM